MAFKYNPFTKKLDIIADLSDLDVNEEILYVDGNPESHESLACKPVTTDNFFMSTTLASNRQYVAAFTGRDIRFFDCRNPYAIEQITILAATPNLATFGQPQAITSIGDFIYVCTTNGKIHTIDWSNILNPSIVASATISSGQHYDIATNGVDTLFIANTTNNQFIAVDASNPLSLTLINTAALGGFGAGVAYYDGYAYCGNFQLGQIHTFEFGAGTWNQIDVTPSAPNSSRLGICTNAEGEAVLISNRYNAASFAVHLLSDPANIGTANIINAPESLNIYSRALSVNGVLYVNSTLGNVMVYDLRDLDDITLLGTYEPKYPDNTKRFSSGLGSVSVENFGSVTKSNDYLVMIGANFKGAQTPSNRNIQVLELPIVNIPIDKTRVLTENKTIIGYNLNYEIAVDSITVSLPTSPIDGSSLNIYNFSGGSATIDGNGNNIMGLASQTIFDNESFNLIYNNTEWKII
jgi:hypothetical protein